MGLPTNNPQLMQAFQGIAQQLKSQAEMGQVDQARQQSMGIVPQNFNPIPNVPEGAGAGYVGGGQPVQMSRELDQAKFIQALLPLMARGNQGAQTEFTNRMKLRPETFTASGTSGIYQKDYMGNVSTVRPPPPPTQVQKNAVEVPTGRPIVIKNGEKYEEVVAGDPTDRTPLPGAKPYLKHKGSQTIAGMQAVAPVDDKLAKSIADYKTPINSIASLRGMRREIVLNRVLEIDPTFDMTQYNARLKLRTDFTSGKGAANIRSLNTLGQHADKLGQMGDALKNDNLQVVNTVVNYFARQTGDPSVTNFDTAAGAVANEAVTVFKNTGATDQEIEHVRNVINSSSSPEQITGYIKTLLDLVNGRIAALKSQWEQGMGKPADFKMLDKNTIEVLNRYGIQPADLGGQPPQQRADFQEFTVDGKKYRIPSAEVEEFKRDMGVK